MEVAARLDDLVAVAALALDLAPERQGVGEGAGVRGEHVRLATGGGPCGLREGRRGRPYREPEDGDRRRHEPSGG
jgi:hypothetical protein